MERIACALVARFELRRPMASRSSLLVCCSTFSWPPIGLLISLEPGSDDIA